MCFTLAHTGMSLLLQGTMGNIEAKFSENPTTLQWDTTVGTIVGSIIPDMEPASYMLCHKLIGYRPPCGHFIFHSIVLAPLWIPVFSTMTYLGLKKIKGLNSTNDISFKNILTGFTIGWCTHFLTDALIHTPKQQWPFWPLSTNNPFYQHLFTRTDGNIIGLLAFSIFVLLTIYYLYQTKV